MNLTEPFQSQTVAVYKQLC